MSDNNADAAQNVPVVGNAQYADAYAKEHQRAAETGECPFCKEQRDAPEVIIHRGSGWYAKELPDKWKAMTFWPKDAPRQIPAQSHYLLIPERHIALPDQMEPEDWVGIGMLFHHLRHRFSLPGGALCMRFDEAGALGYSGRTVFHLHAHLIVPPTYPDDLPNPGRAQALPAPFWVG